jgi:phosphopantothenoylcysteine decarboxylase/phosphopantothenate--cysteine ligase
VKPLRFLITAGPTREPLDPVRFLSNRSSGKMGYALARAACRYGKVTLVSGPVALKPPSGVQFVPVTTTAELLAGLESRFDACDVLIMAAAVCDYRPRRYSAQKLKKAGTLALELVQNPDVVAVLARRKRHQIVVGFAAETNDLLINAAGKLRRKHLDCIVANDARAMDADTNQVTLLFADGRLEALPEMSKTRVATAILKRVTALRT